MPVGTLRGMSLTEGQLFAGYTVVRLLGSGGMGEVYLARHPRLPRQDALKVLPESVSADEEFRARFNREADLAATLWHPHIVGVHDRGEFDGRLWISMDYVDGTDAGRLSREHHPNGMPAADVTEIVSAVAEALDYAHGEGLLHRDVKPANILLTGSARAARRILLADFGIARHTDDESGLTRTNMTVGSVSYTAPEQLMGDAVDGRADQYSLAATAFHLLTGSPPFPHSNPTVVISRHLNTAAPPPSASVPTLAGLDSVIAKALAKDPDQRFDTCQEFAEVLAGAATGIAATPIKGPDPAPPATGADPAPATESPAEPTTHLTTPPAIQASADPVPSAEPTTQHAAAPIVVSSWGVKESARDPDPMPVPSPAPQPVPVTASRRIPPAVILGAAVAAIALIAGVTFALIGSGQSTQPTAAPTTTGLSAAPTETPRQDAISPSTATRTSIRTVTVNPPPAPAPPPPPPAPAGPTNPPASRGSVFVSTVSGKTVCQIRITDVGCEVAFTLPAPMSANGVRVYPSGRWEWVSGDMGEETFATLNYGTTYQALGWTITATSDGTAFTNTATGHGMFVSVDSVRPF
jgi:serine/threonine protein kinase, bacterial